MEPAGKFDFKLSLDRTTHKQDFRVPRMVPPVHMHEWTRVPERPEKTLRQKPYAPKDIHTMRHWTNLCNVPFNLFWELKPITQTLPRYTFPTIPKIEDPLKEHAIKTRPRRYMTPAVSVDDIIDKEVRELLCSHMYTTEWGKASKEVSLKYTQREIPNTTFEKSPNPIQENYSIYKPLPPGWKNKGKAWEIHQYTTLVDPTKEFWIHYNHSLNTPTGIDPFKTLVSDKERKEIRELIKEDELRFSYDKVKSGFAGYIPRNANGQLRKQELNDNIAEK